MLQKQILFRPSSPDLVHKATVLLKVKFCLIPAELLKKNSRQQEYENLKQVRKGCYLPIFFERQQIYMGRLGEDVHNTYGHKKSYE